MEDVFLEEFGFIFVNVWEKVCVLDGLELEENFGDLEEICGKFFKLVELDLVLCMDKISFFVFKFRIRD